MPSPFPGMNPYLEQDDAWHDFHERLIPCIASLLEPQTDDDLIVKIEQQSEGNDEGFIKILDCNNRRLVTVIEVLSPAFKYSGPNRDLYLSRRHRVLVSQSHLVEVDLLRGGLRMLFRDLPAFDNCVLLSRVESRPSVELWTIKLRDRLPVIPIPLRAPHEDLRLDLQQAVDSVYDASGYRKYIYDSQP